jgi:hypothetical protein
LSDFLELDTISTICSGLEIISLSIESKISHSFNPALSAMLQTIGDKIIPDVFIIHKLTASFRLGINFVVTFVSNFVLIVRGPVHIINAVVKITVAIIKLKQTQAKIIIICFIVDFETRLFLFFIVSSLYSSQKSFTNHQIGNQLIVYSVPDLSLNNLVILGGIHIQNSSTFTQKSLANKKCPSS